MKKFKPREWLLLIVPLVLLAGALVIQLRPSFVQSVKERVRPPTRFFVESMKRVSLTPEEVAGGDDTKIEVVLNYSGAQPAWWNKQNGAIGSYNRGDRLVLRQNQKKLLRSYGGIFVRAPYYDPERKRYVAHYLLNLARLPKSNDDVMLIANLAVGMMGQTKPVSPTVPIIYHVRRANEVVKTPTVSRNVGMRIERVLMTRYSPQQLAIQRGYDTLVRVVFKRQAGVPLYKVNASTGYTHLLSENKHEISVDRVDFFRNAAQSDYEPLPDSQLSETYFLDYHFNFPKEQHQRITLKNQISLRGTWPLRYSAVIYDAKRAKNFGTANKPIDVPFTQRPAPPRR
jgi:hypothetical protein